MATVKIEAALGNLGDLSDFIGAGALTVVVATPTTLTLTDAQGDGFTFTGTGLSYGVTGVTGGTFTGLTVFTGAGATLQTVTDFSTSAQQTYLLYQFGGISAAVLELFKSNDTMTGSSVGDKLFGFSGNDTIKGGDGNDIIGGSVGKDKLFGQKGSDVFLFVAGDGKDTIMDFTDTGGRSDDLIGLAQKTYNQMTMEETASGVTLRFGTKGEIVVNNWTLADVDITDFLIA